MTGYEWGLMGVLAILWGVSFFFSKVALAELPPFTLVLGRYLRVLATAGATNVMLVTLLMPIVALLVGALLLGELVTGAALAGMALIGVGLLAIDGRLLGVRRAVATPPSSRSKAA